MASGAKVKGLDKMQRRLKNLRKRFPDEVARAMFIETEIEAKEVKRRTPVDTGNLRASVHVLGPIRKGRSITTMIVAGGPAAPYAQFVHENLEAFHKVGQAKFIESVILESRPYLLKRIAARVDMIRALEG